MDIFRHRAAITRKHFSRPIQRALDLGIIKQGVTVFDYGMGKGDDVHALNCAGIDTCGFDPHFAPNASKHICDVVNLGFVLNVIPTHEERVRVLRDAWALAGECLLVSCRPRIKPSPHHIAHSDGVLNSRGIFQKAFNTTALRELIKCAGLERGALSSEGAGMVFVSRI